MLEQPAGRTFLAAPLELPYGRGVNFQIEVSDIDALYEQVGRHAFPVYLPIEERWYCTGDVEVRTRQFVVRDPDGYLLRFCQDVEQRPAGSSLA